jgi:hypothetical protein
MRAIMSSILASGTALGGSVRGPAANQQGDVRGYREAREVERVARAISFAESAEARGALDRLTRALANKETPLRRDVPRGYYLNIRI